MLVNRSFKQRYGAGMALIGSQLSRGGQAPVTATIAGVVGWGKTVGCIASSITVDLCEPGHVRRAAGKSGTRHTVFRTGEVHGRTTDRVKEICRLVSLADSAMVTFSFWIGCWLVVTERLLTAPSS